MSIHPIAASNGSLAPNITNHPTASESPGRLSPLPPIALQESRGNDRADDNPFGLHYRPTPRRRSRVSDDIVETALQPQEHGRRWHATISISLVMRLLAGRPTH